MAHMQFGVVWLLVRHKKGDGPRTSFWTKKQERCWMSRREFSRVGSRERYDCRILKKLTSMVRAVRIQKKVTSGGDSGGASRFFYCAKAGKAERNAGLDGNNHPTVKPLNLMRYLVRLVTPPGGVCLDPFAGSGTTGCACVLEGFRFIGIEKEGEYADIAKARITHWYKQRITN
jgi:DNA methylase